MPEYLKQLIKAEQWQKALTYAEQIASRGDRSLQEMVVVYSAILRARVALRECRGAVAAGDLAVNLAKELGEWDIYGEACNDLGVAHFLLKQYEQATYYFGEYLANVPRFERALDQQTLVWYNLGLLHQAQGRSSEAIAALTHALTHAKLTGDGTQHGIMLALIDALLKAGQFEKVPRLLAQSAAHLRRQPANTAQGRRLYHALFHAEYALLTGRLHRARVLAVRGLAAAEGKPRYQYGFHALLCKVEEQAGFPEQAREHAFSARAYAVACHRSDLESEASGMIQRLIAPVNKS